MEKRAIAKLSASVVAVGLAACAMTGVFSGGELIWQAPPAVNETHEEASAPAEAVKQKAVPADPERLMRTRPEIRMIPDNAGENGAPAEMPAEAGPADPERLMRTRPEIREIPAEAEESGTAAEAETTEKNETTESTEPDASRFMRSRPSF